MIAEQDANVGPEAASETKQSARPATRESDSETTSRPPPPSSRPQKPSTDESEDRVGAFTERIMTGQQDTISPVNPVDDPDPAVQDGRPIFTRMSRRYLSIETLRTFELDFDLDPDPEYVLIKRWVPDPEQDRLWAHTKSIRERRGGPLVSEKWKPQKDAPEFAWVRHKKPGRRRSKNPALLMYLAGVKPSEETNQTEEPDEQPYSSSDTEDNVQEQEGGGSKNRSEHSPIDDEEAGEAPFHHREDGTLIREVRGISLPSEGEDPSTPTAHEEPHTKTPPGDGSWIHKDVRMEENAIHSSKNADSKKPEKSKVTSGTSAERLEGAEETQWEGFFMCECCPEKPQRFKTIEELSAHEAEKTHECLFCGRWFMTEAAVRFHRDLVHAPFQNVHEAQEGVHADLDGVQTDEGSDILQHEAQDAAGDPKRTVPGVNRGIEK
ncbi:hypothetical protein CDV31_013694 [Fusarium ambrosium]|uniref:C2H2-type domain-containing protein n=1 Tax=Fusarium ambrosium TaxID=131363 RepID=A0A428T1I8_9HYPO|nr:hypothetical protein CDV31_013694 [Fusarium ambrosium]